MKKKKELKYNAWNEYLNNTREKTEYSSRRMDLLIISICGAGIYIIYETIREFKTGNVEIENSNLLFWTGTILILSIVSNFLSQLTGYYANFFEEKYIVQKLKKLKGGKNNKKETKKYDDYITNLNKLTSLFNILSMILMLFGLSLMIYFNYTIF